MAKQNLGMVTAYAYAVVGGYEGTEAEFEALLGNIATDLAEIENLTVIANTLPSGSSATASYDHGVLTLGIPKGDKGDTGAGATVTVGTTATGNPGTNASVINSGTTKDAVFNFTIPRGDTGNGIESIELTDTQGAVKTYTILFTDGNTTTFDVTDGEVTNATLTAVLADYAKIDGAYESMTVGNAEQLVSSIFEEDSVPYNFRTSGGSIDIGDRETDMLVGGTVAWNQLLQDFANPPWSTSETVSISDGIVTLTPTATWAGTQIGNIHFDAGHKYFVSIEGKLAASGTVISVGTGKFGVVTIGVLDSTSYKRISTIATAQTTEDSVYNLANRIGVADFYLRKPMLIDLTAMFGTTIADYIYTLEQANAGAGVAWFKKLFPKPYYEYNAGELMSVQASSHDMVGFNAWDEEWEVGGYNVNTGAAAAAASRIRSKNFIPVIPNATYYSPVSNGLTRIFFDADKNYLEGAWVVSPTFTVPANAHYMKFNTGDAYGNTYKGDITINLSWDGERDGEYEAYVKHSYPLDSSLTLRGIPKLDASNNLYYDGDTYESDGTVTRKWGFYTIQTSDITLDDGGGYTNVVCAKIQNLPSMLKTNAKQAIHSKYGVAQVVWPFDDTSNIGKFANNPATQAYWFIFPIGTTIEQMRTALVGTTLVYELATPTTETADPYTNPQIVDDFGTEEYIDYAVSQGDRDVSIPVGHETQYMANLKAKLEMSPNSPEGAGDYIVRQTNGENEYVTLASNATIQDIIARLEALEGGGE